MKLELKENINVIVDLENKILWLFIGNENELHYSFITISNFYNSINEITSIVVKNQIKTIIMKSPNKKVWNMGGDLEFFIKCIKEGKKNSLYEYAYNCITIVHTISNAFNSNAVVIALVQGNAYGGGFECALAADYIVSESHVKYSFPESIFGSFPGMGAYSFLTRKVGYEKANDMICSNKRWNTKELVEMNIVHSIFKGDDQEIIRLIQKDIFKSKDVFSKICCIPSLAELKTIVDKWLSKTINLEKDKINFMEKLIKAQKRALKN